MKTATLPGGYLVPENDLIGKWCVETGRLDHDRFLVPFCCGNIPAGGVAVDAGAYIGDHTIAYSAAAGPNGVVYAIEAGAENYNLLWHNSKLFPLKNVRTLRAALGKEMGRGFYYADPDNRGGSFVVPTEDPDAEICSVMDLDTICELVKVDFVKLDIEGSEAEALLGMKRILENDRPRMVIEINRGALARRGATFEGIQEILQRYGYSWKNITPEGFPVQFELFCTPWEKIKV